MTDSLARLLAAANGRLASPAGLALLAVAGVVLLYLVYDHRVHVLGLLPYLVLLACPLMHLFHHGRHGHGHGRDHREGPREPGR
ncbi:MAG TPA: DUF2933 domain-containing protein [Ramlibacter sp.]